MLEKRMSLKNYLMLSFLVMFVCILFVLFLTMNALTKMQQKTMENNLTSYSSRVVLDVEQTYENIGNIAQSLAYTQIVQDYLMETDATDKSVKFESYNNIYSLLVSNQKLNSCILDIAIVGKNGNNANINSDISIFNELFDLVPTSNQPIVFLGKQILYIREESYEAQIAAVPIYQTSNLTQFLGVLFIALDTAVILGNTDQDTTGMDIQLLMSDSDGNLLSGDDLLYKSVQESVTSDIFSVTHEEINYECRKYELPSSDAFLYTLFNRGDYVTDMSRIMYSQVIFIILAFLISVILFLLFLKPAMASLGQLTRIMNAIGSGKRKAMNERITISADAYRCKEVYAIVTSFNDMLDETARLNHAIFDSYTKMYELEMVNRSTEIAYLRSQINPHFLYNTLTLICGMAASGESERVIDVTQALSMIFRYSIKGADMVNVREELDMVRSYVMIQMLRFEDRFTVEFNVSDEALDAMLPKMVIQPLVENAITHGLEKSMHKGHLQIGALLDKRDNTLVLWVYDTGIGMSRDKLEEIRQLLRDTTTNKSQFINQDFDAIENRNTESVGLCNVNSRIYLYYGEEYSLNVDSDEAVGTNVQMRIPYRTKEEAINVPGSDH